MTDILNREVPGAFSLGSTVFRLVTIEGRLLDLDLCTPFCNLGVRHIASAASRGVIAYFACIASHFEDLGVKGDLGLISGDLGVWPFPEPFGVGGGVGAGEVFDEGRCSTLASEAESSESSESSLSSSFLEV